MCRMIAPVLPGDSTWLFTLSWLRYILPIYMLAGATMRTARLFRNGDSQAVRLPKEFRFEGDRVLIKRLGPGVVLLPVDRGWEVLEDSLQRFTPDFMTSRQQPLAQEREPLE